MSRLPSLNGLRAFEAAARHLSFTNAAAELNVTQTAISHQIRRLEQELGIRLFVRQNRALALTSEARDYLPGVRAAFNDLRLATDRLLRKDNEHVLTVSTLASLVVSVTVTPVLSFYLLPRMKNLDHGDTKVLAWLKARYRNGLQAVLDNEPGPARDIVVLNAGVALYAAGVAPGMAEGVALAREAIGSGRALAKLHQFVARTKELAPA